MSIKNHIAATLKEHRVAAGLAQEKLAHMAGISTRYYAKIESAESLPSIDIIFNLARALEVDFSALIRPAWDIWLELPITE